MEQEQSKRIRHLISEGVRPSKIAAECKIPVGIVTEFLEEEIEKLRIPRSQVLATLENEWQRDLAVYAPAWTKALAKNSVRLADEILKMVKECNTDAFDLDVGEVKLYLKCFQRGFKDGDVYEALCEIERTLHAKIKNILVTEHGEKDSGWWRKGVPVGVRTKCVEACEKDEEWSGDGPYNYTTIIHLKEIVKENSNLFQQHLPLDASHNMKKTLTEMTKLNGVRNRVMHPVRTAPLSENDFFFVRDMREKFDITKWR